MTTQPTSEPTAPAGPPAGPPSGADARPAGLVFGIVLIVVGAIFLAVRLADLQLGGETWPLWIVLPGLGLFLAALFIGGQPGLGLTITGAIVATVGGILWVQETYDLYATWAYAWALVAPTAPGVAMVAYGLVHGDRRVAADGATAAITGLGLFLVFGLFFEAVIGLSGERIEGLDDVFPVLAIGLGLVLVVLSLFGRRGPARG